MKFSCIKKDLEKGLNVAGLFVGKNLDLPVLSCVILESKKSFLKILATNINTACEYKVNIKSDKDGRVAVNSETLLKTIANIKDEQISLELKENVLHLKTDSAEVEINTLDHSDFPSIPKTDKREGDVVEIDISQEELLNGLNATHYAASRSTIKPELSSVFINFDLKQTNFVATDGFRLSEKTINTQTEGKQAQILLPLESADQFIKLLGLLGEGEVGVVVSKDQVFLHSNDFTIFSRLTNGDFVDYQKLIPEENQTTVVFLKQDFIDISKLVNIFANDFNQIEIAVKKKEISFSTQNKKGHNLTKIPATVKGDDLEMNFNHKYILDSMPSINTDSVELVFNANKPLIIRPVGDQSFQYIVMPLSK